jgi:hypothetical protein
MKLDLKPLGAILVSSAFLGCAPSTTRSDESVDGKAYKQLRGAAAKLSPGSPLCGAFSGIEDSWLIENTKTIPTASARRTIFTIGGKDWEFFLILTVAGDLGYNLRLHEFFDLCYSNQNENHSSSTPGANISMIKWATIRNGSIVDVNGAPIAYE